MLRLVLLLVASSTSTGLRLPTGAKSRREWLLSASAAVASAAALLPLHQQATASDTPPITFKAYSKGNK